MREEKYSCLYLTSMYYIYDNIQRFMRQKWAKVLKSIHNTSRQKTTNFLKHF